MSENPSQDGRNDVPSGTLVAETKRSPKGALTPGGPTASTSTDYTGRH